MQWLTSNDKNTAQVTGSEKPLGLLLALSVPGWEGSCPAVQAPQQRCGEAPVVEALRPPAGSPVSERSASFQPVVLNDCSPDQCLASDRPWARSTQINHPRFLTHRNRVRE